ncbi:BEN domain-containing protein 5 [Epinephelus fuscoguttatus]|uniref:BEN domain-containing protein 5 n=1 Tax=Epinephelus fuscoguttatus TaxID=293821 RepID=UPI0020D0D78F|nr:BEN domain-containing protein 5 [Epinephelus fuscoguttatus]
MYAYVKYVDDGCKEIVPTTDIKDFDMKLFSSDKIYWVRWKEAFYKAQIIFIKETREAVEDELSSGKRVRVRKVKEASPVAPPSERQEAKAKNINHRKAAEEAKKTNLLAILDDMKKRKKLSPICPTPQKKMKNSAMLCSVPSEEEEDDDNEDDEDDEDDDGGVVPQKMYEEVQRKYHYHGLYRGLRLQLEETKKKLEEQQRLYTEVEAEHKIIRKLNIELQQQLLCTLNSSLSSKCNDPACSSPRGTPEIADSGSGSPVEPAESTNKDEIDLGGGVWIRKDVWARVQTNGRDSLFVKELAVAIWGTKTLGDKSLTGKTCPTTKTNRQPLTPQKLQTLKVCFREWLQSKNVDDTEIQARCGKAGRYITEKIMDINKQKTKTTTPN